MKLDLEPVARESHPLRPAPAGPLFAPVSITGGGLLETLFLQAPFGCVIACDGLVIHHNPRFAELFGLHSPGINGRPIPFAFVEPSQARRIDVEAARRFAAGDWYETEVEFQRMDGGKFWAHLHGYAVAARMPGAVRAWLVEDRSAYRSAEQQLRRETEAMLHQHETELEELVAARTRALVEANARLENEIAERARIEERMRHMAQHDELTGLPNRALLGERLQHTIAMQPAGTSFAVLFADLDRFKTVNDTLGHGCGDTLLKTVARRLQFSLRKGDTVARVGGDEFVVVLPGADATTARDAAARLLALIAEPIAVGEMSLHVTPSIGICLHPRDGDSPDLLLRHADAAMYQAKSSGRNGFAFYSPSAVEDTSRAFHLEHDLRRAFAQEQFEVYFQPVCRLSDRRVVGLEALMRWRHPEQGLVGAGEFVGVAEESGLIQPIGDWVFGQACSILATWRAAGIDVPKVSVNLSVQQLWRPGLVERVTERLQHHGLTGKMIEFEITEQTVMTPTAETLDILRSLRAAGIALSIDDFGTGYSSLNYLRTLPVTKLKIDRTFIADVDVNPDDNPIVRAILAMAKALDLSVVAEGIENAGQADRLRDYGCELGQGYFLSHPLRAADIPALLNR